MKDLENYLSKKKLETVHRYAKRKEFSLTWIYQLIKSKKVKFLKIDGMIFINENGK